MGDCRHLHRPQVLVAPSASATGSRCSWGLPTHRGPYAWGGRSSESDCLLQMADFIAHTLLKQEEQPVPRVESLGIDGAFSILDKALNRKASRRDPQGVVRR